MFAKKNVEFETWGNLGITQKSIRNEERIKFIFFSMFCNLLKMVLDGRP